MEAIAARSADSLAPVPINRERLTWTWPLIMLVSRTALFAAAQALIAAILAALGTPGAWGASAAWWPYSAALASVVCFFLLRWLFRREGVRLREVFAFDRQHLLRDGLLALGLAVVSGPLAYFPMGIVATWLFGEPMQLVNMMFRPLPLWAAYGALIVFPVTVALTEGPTYFAYVMPRLEALSGSRWLAVLLAGFWLSAQHATLPLIFDARFMLWRLGMYLLFALFIGAALHWKPRLLPYWMIVHALLDIQAAMMVLSASQ